MSVWKKNSIAVVIGIMLLSFFPTNTYAVTCAVGQQLNSTGTGCVATPIPNTSILPTNTVYDPCSVLTGAAKTRCQDAQTAQSALSRFNPNVNINAGNSYGGVSISGVGGAIASCTNVGSFLVNTASDLLSSASKKSVQSAFKAAYQASGVSSEVSVSDKKTQEKIDSMNRTTQCLDGIAYAVAKNTLAQVTNKTLNWVNTGLNGNPLYVQNVGSYLQNIKNQQVANFLQTIPGTDPIFGNALESVIRQSVTGKVDGYLNVAQNTPQAKAYNSFINDFTSGGWDSLLNPSYNSVGALFNATDQLSYKINSQQTDAQNEIQRNNGFLDMKRCVQYSNTDATSDPATAIRLGLSTQPTCTQWVTDTPGSIIANQVATITTSPTRQLEYADRINEVLGGFFDNFVNNLLSKGLRGSGSGSTINFGFSSPGANTVLGSDGTALSVSGNTADLGYQSSGTGSGIDQNFDISRPQQLRAILQTQYDFLNRSLDAQAALARVVPTIGALDYCIPGPNPSWADGTDSNWQTFMGGLEQAPANSPSTLSKVVSALPGIGGVFNAIFGGDDTPQVWTTPGIIADPVTGLSVQVPRTFYLPSDNSKGPTTQSIIYGMTKAYNQVKQEYQAYGSNTLANAAFVQAAQNDADVSYVGGFVNQAYTETANLVEYNKAASTIDAQYDTNITQTQSNIEQMRLILSQVDAIVAGAKARYIAQRAAQGNPVDMACINNAYEIDTTPITPVARQEGSSSNDPFVQHSVDASNFFYGKLAI